jgi:hypothetical protein
LGCGPLRHAYSPQQQTVLDADVATTPAGWLAAG